MFIVQPAVAEGDSGYICRVTDPFVAGYVVSSKAFHPGFRAGMPVFRACMLAAGACLWPLQAAAAEDYSQWTRSARVFLNTTPDGANVNANVTGFPLLIRLDAGNFAFPEALGKGQDIRFSKAGSLAPLSYQIERWDSAGAAAEIWVKLDTVIGNSRDQYFNMHWGRPGAADSSKGNAVFEAGAGFVAVWHLGGSGARANAVAGGNPAVPNLYDGDESKPGIIGLADSLDGGPSGDFLDLGDGYAGFASGFTYTVWANAAAPLSHARLLDLGNGAGIDNIALFRGDTTDDLVLRVHNGTATTPRVTAPGAINTKVWQHFAVTVAGRVARIYRNGDLIQSDTMDIALATVNRTLNVLGKSNWPNNDCFRGKLDEPVIARVARGPEWIRLSHANQRIGQNVVTFQRQDNCQAAFAAPGDTSVPERGSLSLAATADCASEFAWTLVSGPGPRILDPAVKVLQVFLPRVSGDAELVYRFNARFPDGEKSREVKVSVQEGIPDPVFTLPPALYWNGRDSLAIRPAIANLSALKSSRDSILYYAWTHDGASADTAWLEDGLLLRKSAYRKIQVSLCLHNGGAPACDSTVVTVDSVPTAIRLGPTPKAGPETAEVRSGREGRDARGKRLPPGSRLRAFPGTRCPECRPR